MLSEVFFFYGIVRADGEYKITAKGAQGGDGASKVGGSGAVVSASFANELHVDQIIDMIGENKNTEIVTGFEKWERFSQFIGFHAEEGRSEVFLATTLPIVPNQNQRKTIKDRESEPKLNKSHSA